MSEPLITDEDVDAVAELLARVSWDEDPIDEEPGIDETDDEDEE